MVHGAAVALGLVAACRVSHALGFPDLEPDVRGALRRCGLDDDVDRWLTGEVLARVAVDKKRSGRQLRFVVVRGVGQCEVVELALDDLPRILRPRSST